MLLETEQDPRFSQPTRQILAMILILILVGVGTFFIYRSIAPIFLANVYLNGFIVAVFVIGVLACFWQVLQLVRAVSWIEGFALNRPGHEFVQAPRLLTSLAALLKDKRTRAGISAGSSRTILESVATRLDEARDITRYIINLLIFLGLLGTFYGLATTVPAVVETIRALAPEDGEGGVAVFDRLIVGLEAQLGGMGTAFASSLLGLAGSLIVGILELFAGHGQNRFYTELENWLSGITRIGVSGGDGQGGFEAGPVADMIEQSNLRMESLREALVEAERARRETDARIEALTAAVGALAARAEADPTGEALSRIAAGQERLATLFEERDTHANRFDEETRERLRNIDVQMLRLLEEMNAGRADTVAELRTEISALTDAMKKQL
ncbi:MAG: biopolymer transporter ExbB [Rubricella sp.]